MKGFIIRQLMADKKVSVKMIAEKTGTSSQAVSLVIHGKSTSRRVSQAVADAIGKPLEEVFPKYRKHKEAA